MYPAAMLARAGLLLCLVVGSRQLSIKEFEVPAAWESGENVELRCAGDLEEKIILKWWWTPLNALEEKAQLYQRVAGSPGFLFRHNHITSISIEDNDTLVLVAPTPADSGTYECEITVMSEKSEEVREGQVLTIFTQGSGPNLTISGVDDDSEEPSVLVECRADDVAPAPDISLTVDGTAVNMTEQLSGPDSEGLYAIVGNVTLSTALVDGYEVRCELFYTNPDIAHQPYVHSKLYDPSGAATTTAAPKVSTEPDATPDSLNQSGDSCQCRVSWPFLLALGFLSQLPAIL